MVSGANLFVSIVGSGPSSFYVAQRLLKRMPNVFITFYERLREPFGLVRFGVAPDHIDVKVSSALAHYFE